MDIKISVVINTLNSEEDIKRVISSVKWADEIIVCDMESEDKTVSIAKDLGAKVFNTKRLEYVEPARNLAIAHATNEWILILDPDEEINESLKNKLTEIAGGSKAIDFVKIPRKNMIFGRWMKASMWWPDLNVRFFRKNKVKWNNKIHRPPESLGEGLDLEAKEEWAIVHHHYNSIDQFLVRMMRYTKIQAQELIEEGYKPNWRDLIEKPLAEFLSRFFANKGFEDGMHGLVLSLLQAFSFLVVYLKVWEHEKFKSEEIVFNQLKELKKETGSQLDYWIKYGNLSSNPFKRFIQKAKNRL
jgi:(heptosyl)LPS beta-1,4-glucosyltransferase